MSSRGVIDLRPGKKPRKPLPGQSSLFASRPPQVGVRRPLPLRARRRRVRAAIVLAVTLALAAIVWGISFVTYLPALSIRGVSVSGAEHVSPQLIADYVETILNDGSYRYLSRTNVLLYPRDEIEQKVVAYFPRLQSASAERPALFSRELVIAVSERKDFAFWCSAAGCYDMDPTGFIFAAASSTAATSTEYVFGGGIATSSAPVGQTFAVAHLPALITLLNALGQSGFTPLGATVENDTDLSVPLQQGFALKVSFGESPDVLIKNLQLVLSSDALQGKTGALEYVDLRFGDRVYFKLNGQTEASSTPR